MNPMFNSKVMEKYSLDENEDRVFNNFDINHLFGKEKLEDIQEKIARATGLAFVTVDYKGEPVTELTSFTAFCREVRHNKAAERLCRSSDAFGAIQAAVTQKTSVYFCPCGLLEVAIPIIVRGHYLGGFIGGQIRCLNAPANCCKLETVMHHCENFKETRKDLYNDILKLDYEKFVSVADLISLIINQLGEKELSRLMQKDYLNKEIECLDKKKKKMELEYSVKNTELTSLKSQMNPSFLFRCLNSISNLAVIENAPKTNEMVNMFAEFLRFNITNTKNAIPIIDELKNIERYLKIQQVRLGERLKYSINIPDNLQTQKIPSHILMPIIEKTIFYGIDQNLDGGTIIMSVYYNRDDIVVSIQDDVPKSSNEKSSLKYIPYKAENFEIDAIESGILNVRQRLITSFGTEYDIIIESHDGKGTKFLIRYPKNFDEKVI